MTNNKSRTRGAGRGRGPGTGEGPGGTCVCPKCGYKTSHIVGQPCIKRSCSKCGSPMARA